MAICYGMHVILRISSVTNTASLDSAESVSSFLKEAVTTLGMRILAGPTVGYEEGLAHKSGCSGVVILYESHAAIHTYPNLGEAFIDIFSCRAFEVETVLQVLQKYFGNFEITEQTLLDRGLHWGSDLALEQTQWNQQR